MSSAVVSTSAALSRPFLFVDAESEPKVDCHPERSERCAKRIARGGSLLSHDRSSARVIPASRLAVLATPEMASSGISTLDALAGGLPRGCLTEIYGPASSGRTTVLLAALAAATRRGEYCALIDASDALDPFSLSAAGVDFDHMLWVRCHEESLPGPRNTERKKSQDSGASLFSPPLREVRSSEHRLEQVLRATDLLLESGGFGLIILDLADVPPQTAHRIPLTTWFRFRRAVEHKPTILLAIEQQPIAGSCSSLLLKLAAAKRRKSAAHDCPERSRRSASRGSSVDNEKAPEERKKNCGDDSESINPTHTHLLSGLEINLELIRSRLDRKPAQSITFTTKTAWAG